MISTATGKPIEKPFVTLTLKESDEYVVLMVNEYGLLRFDRASHSVTAFSSVPAYLGFALDSAGRIIVE